MKIFTPNIKTVNKLTKYISPASIEKARYKKFNAPLIDDGNLLCDEFFRTKELFDRKKDEIVSFCPYGIDDLPVYDRTSIHAFDIRRVEGPNTNYIESDLPYYVDIIGENKRIYLENYGVKSTKYPHEEIINTDGFLNKNQYSNRTVDEIANIRYYAKKISSIGSSDLEKEALSLLNNGFPLEGVINIMKDATVKTADGKSYSPVGLLRFLRDFPDLKRYMITYDFNKNEVFDTFGAKMFSELLSVCGGDKKLAYKILWDCRTEMAQGCYLTNPYVLEAGMKLYQIDNCWNDKKSEIADILSKKNKKYIREYKNLVVRMINNNKSLDEIKNELLPKQKSDKSQKSFLTNLF